MQHLISSDTDDSTNEQVDPFSALDSFVDGELQRENATLKATIGSLKETVSSLRLDIERLESLVQRQHDDHKVYYKVFKDKL
ncbi:hypothetical protein HDU80_003225, partial [Chytriomyces hyalinus]